MKKKTLFGLVVLTGVFAFTGCTYNDVYYNSETVNYHPPRREIPIVFAHKEFPGTHHLQRRRRFEPIDCSCSERRRREACRNVNDVKAKCTNCCKPYYRRERNETCTCCGK